MSKKIFLILLFIYLTLPQVAQAALVPECARSGEGSFCCALLMISNFSRWLLGIIGAGALLMFIYGGFSWITSFGNSNKIQKGKDIIVKSTVGVFITAIAWFGVNFVITSLAGSPQIVGTNKAWYAICEGFKCSDMGPGWSCQNVRGCKLQDYTQCEEAKNCERFLCPGDNNNVCCNPDMETGLTQ